MVKYSWNEMVKYQIDVLSFFFFINVIFSFSLSKGKYFKLKRHLYIYAIGEKSAMGEWDMKT